MNNIQKENTVINNFGEPTTIDAILSYIKEKVENHIPISAGVYLDLAIKLTALLGNLDDELIEAEMFINKFIAGRIELGDTSSKSKILAQAKDEYGSLLKLKAERERIEQFIMLAKKRCSLQSFDQ